MAQLFVTPEMSPFNLDAYIQTLDVAQVTNDQINVICDTANAPIIIDLPRCPTTPANLKLLIAGTQKLETNNVTVRVAPASGIYGQDKCDIDILDPATKSFFILNKEGQFAMLQILITSFQLGGYPLNEGAWVGISGGSNF